MFRFDDDKTYRMPAHFGGTVFDPEAKAYYHDVMALGYTYTADGDRLADYVPEGFELIRPELTESAWTGSGTLRWTAPTWEQNPMQRQIIKALA